MLQAYVSPHTHPDSNPVITTATTSSIANTAKPFTTGAGVAVSALGANYNVLGAVTGLAGISAVYVAQYVSGVSGASDLHIVCSAAVTLSRLPVDAIVLPFIIDKDLGTPANQTFTLSDPDLRFLPCEQQVSGVSSIGGDSFTVSLRQAFPIPNPQVTRYFGVMVIGTFGAAARPIIGAISIREADTEQSTFMANK